MVPQETCYGKYVWKTCMENAYEKHEWKTPEYIHRKQFRLPLVIFVPFSIVIISFIQVDRILPILSYI